MDNIFFILSKLAWSLLSPSNLLVLLMCLAAILLLINRIRLAKWILLPTAMLSLAILSYPLGDMLINPL